MRGRRSPPVGPPGSQEPLSPMPPTVAASYGTVGRPGRRNPLGRRGPPERYGGAASTIYLVPRAARAAEELAGGVPPGSGIHQCSVPQPTVSL